MTEKFASLQVFHRLDDTILAYMNTPSKFTDDEKSFFIASALIGYRYEKTARIYKTVFGAEISTGEAAKQMRIICALDEINDVIDIAKTLEKTGMRSVYSIHTMNDAAVCPVCAAFENKEFHSLHAVIGKNYPPFDNCTCEFCRCFASFEMK